MIQRAQIQKQPFITDFFDVHEVLGIPKNKFLSKKEIDDVYRGKMRENIFDAKLFFSWKLLRDPLYSSLVPDIHDFSELYSAGFFIDTLDITDVYTVDFIQGECRTPIAGVSENLSQLKTIKKPVILLCTGAFSPLHNGHIGMANKAREELENQGYQVIGGYFSPSHDTYVSEKYNGTAGLLASHRVYLAQLTVADSDWLYVDPWESRYVATDINFSDVIKRLEMYINFYLQPIVPITVAYVFGDDNIGFCRAFAHDGIGVCIGRKKEIHNAEYIKIKSMYPTSIIFLTSTYTYLENISSSRVRKWVSGLLPERTENLYFKWKKDLIHVHETKRCPKKLFIIRDESSWCLKPWTHLIPLDTLIEAKNSFLQKLENLIQKSFLHVLSPDIPYDMSIRIYSVEDQIKYVEQLMKKENILNLDACTNQDAGIQLSRLFSLCDGQVKPHGLIARPGFPDIETQIQHIQPGTYTILDDDIASGSTMNLLLGILPEKIVINKIRTLLEYSCELYIHTHTSSENIEPYDVVDLRDFIFGARAGGLVVRLPNGNHARAPYSLPYISLITRAKIPPSSEMFFSHEIWKLNLQFFTDCKVDICIKDTDASFQEFCSYLGYASDMTMKDFCTLHLKMLFTHL